MNLALIFSHDRIKPSFRAEAIETEGNGAKKRRRFSFMGR
jgi:hypothetical protein